MKDLLHQKVGYLLGEEDSSFLPIIVVKNKEGCQSEPVEDSRAEAFARVLRQAIYDVFVLDECVGFECWQRLTPATLRWTTLSPAKAA